MGNCICNFSTFLIYDADETIELYEGFQIKILSY